MPILSGVPHVAIQAITQLITSIIDLYRPIMNLHWLGKQCNALRRALIVVGGGFMTAAGLAVVVAMMTVPRWVLTVVMTSPRDMLQRRVTVDEAIGAVTAATVCLKKTVAETESARTVQNERPSSPLFANDRWRAFLAQMQEGDELWTFCTPPETWEHVAGFGGIAVVRHGKIVVEIVTLRS